MRYYSTDQILAEEKEMTDFICERIPSEYRVILAEGEDGSSWADLSAFWDEATGWHLLMEKSDEHVTLEEVYDHFRRQEMSGLECRREREYKEYRSKAFRLELEVASLQQRACDPPPRILTAHDIVEYYEGKISLRLAYEIMDQCKPVRAEGKRLISAESFDEYLRAIKDEPPQDPPPSSEPDESATSRKRPGSRADDGFEFFRFPH